MDKIRNALVVAEAVLALLLMLGVLTQTPKAERQIYWTTWVLVAGFLVCSIANVWVAAHPTQ